MGKMTDPPKEPGKQFGSLDSIQDAIDTLNQSGFNYLLLVGTHENAATIYSDLDKQSAFMLDDHNESGMLQADIRRHLEPILKS